MFTGTVFVLDWVSVFFGRRLFLLFARRRLGSGSWRWPGPHWQLLPLVDGLLVVESRANGVEPLFTVLARVGPSVRVNVFVVFQMSKYRKTFRAKTGIKA